MLRHPLGCKRSVELRIEDRGLADDFTIFQFSILNSRLLFCVSASLRWLLLLFLGATLPLSRFTSTPLLIRLAMKLSWISDCSTNSSSIRPPLISYSSLISIAWGLALRQIKKARIIRFTSSSLPAFRCLISVLSPVLLWSQNPPVAPSNLTEGPKAFVQRCSGCHGADARGTDRRPALVGSHRVSSRSIQQLRDLIYNGIPGTGMPPFDLPAQELDALAALVHSLNGPAAENSLSGDFAAGEQFFFGKGQCAS